MFALIQIFSHLEPLDILRLSRTSRDLRDLLTRRSSEHVWRTARLNVEGLPPLPPDLNEMQYANLAFDNFCHVCKNVHSICKYSSAYRPAVTILAIKFSGTVVSDPV